MAWSPSPSGLVRCAYSSVPAPSGSLHGRGGAGLPSPRDPCSLSENECSIAVMKCKTRARKVEKSMLKREECWGAVEMASGVGMGTV